MLRPILAMLLMTTGCDTDRRARADPESASETPADAQAQRPGADAAPLPDAEGDAGPSRDAAEPDACVSSCPAGGSPTPRCLEGDRQCETFDVCGEPLACLDADCGPGAQPYCPGDSVYAPDCAADAPDCFETTTCGSVHFCRRLQGACPAFTRAVDGCLPDDPLCWVLASGEACMADICPVANICVDGDPVDVCPDDRVCNTVTRCGVVQACASPLDCDDCVPGCGPGRQPVQRCSANGRPCERIAECCSEVFCEVCALDDPSCFDDPDDACPAFTRQILAECPPGDPLCWTLPDGTRCLSLLCDENPLRQFDCDEREIAVPSCEGRAECRTVANCAHTSGCIPGEDVGEPCGDGRPFCETGTREVPACQPNGRRCDYALIPCGPGRIYCESCAPGEPGCDE